MNDTGSHAPRSCTVAEVREIDRRAIEDFGVPGVVLMENAAGGLADAIEDVAAARDARDILIMCGGGNNGGDGYAAARLLDNRGRDVRLVTLSEPREGSDAAVNARICERMKLPRAMWDPDDPPSIGADALIVDAMFGTGLDRGLEGAAGAAAAWINDAGLPVIAADVPSGLDADTGAPLGATVRATVTVTFAAIKRGFLRPESRPYLGQLRLVSIGAPRAAAAGLGAPIPPDVLAGLSLAAATERGRSGL